MKKLFSLILVLAMLLCCTAMAEQAALETYALTEETLTLEQGPVWFWLYYDAAADEYAELHATPAWGDNWQFSENPDGDGVYHSICEWEGIQFMPGTFIGDYIDIAAQWVAPHDGTISIDPGDFIIKDDGAEHPEYLVKIIWISADGESYAPILPEDDTENAWVSTPFVSELAYELDVVAGDSIVFQVRATDNGGAAVSCQPVITYIK